MGEINTNLREFSKVFNFMIFLFLSYVVLHEYFSLLRVHLQTLKCYFGELRTDMFRACSQYVRGMKP
jgi:hypothetical protein